MRFDFAKAIEILSRTPDTLHSLLSGISEDWSHVNEGGDSWSAYDIIGHLIHGEKTDWILRMEIILGQQVDRTFKPFDRFAQFQVSQGQSLEELLRTFAELRSYNLEILQSKNLTLEDLQREGIHPAFGEVSLAQLLSTWVVHDLNHIAQIARVMARQYHEDVGPWIAYLKILNSN
ncbi:MAG: DinB family protein [Saprospiraceae bacterium]|nr:DinB family protein [Saprospiraceae bacterium]HMW39663.1 DinB family protein [Saprospiraceae bacterium]HMX88326.1 DinB family protein [Saprospiraceae bacterium]HMZ40390.1 DinB family protein [Saprospiraceae bacterium]HNB30900.1 DinB family protein [Saprospiraceae bacterium]